MALQLAVTTRNARLDSIETDIGTAPHLVIWSGAQPADCATANSGSALADLTLPSDWLAAASGGSKAKAGTWQVAASGTGTGGHFRIYAAGVAKMQGSVTATGGGGDMTLDNTSIASGQTITVSSFSLTDANA